MCVCSATRCDDNFKGDSKRWKWSLDSAPSPPLPELLAYVGLLYTLLSTSSVSPAAKRSPPPLACVALMAATRSDYHVAVFLENDVGAVVEEEH